MLETTATPAETLDLARQGDIDAFERAVSPFVPSIRRIAYGFCRTRSDADDLAQEALLKAFRSFHGFREGSALGPWLYSVTRSVCHDWYRQTRARGAREEVEFDEQREVSEQVDPQELLLAKDEAERLWLAIRSLDPMFRVPLILFDIEGLSYEQVARVEGVPVGTVRSRLSRARARLQELLEEAMTTPGVRTFSRLDPSPSLRCAK